MDNTIPPSRREAARGHVLVVDTDAVNRDVIAGLLRHLGCAVAQAATGQIALGLCPRESYDMVLIDCSHEPQAKIATIKQLRASTSNSESQIVALVAAGAEHDELREAGVSVAIKKPVTVNGLTRLLDRFLPEIRKPASA
jgi:CheY-like chemotaxis protein